MKNLLLFLYALQCNSYDIFTVQYYNHSLSQINNFSDKTIQEYKLDNHHHVNMYSTFTKNYFENCDMDNDINCLYNLTDQEYACNIYMYQHPNEYDIYRQLYYYGEYDDQNQYEIYGSYIIEDLYPDEIDHMYSINNFSFYNYMIEPNDFHRKMMIYVVETYDHSIFCPVWELKNY